ncbi:MAG: hypothetical protein JWQ96_2936 [Segetibacter sp.]|nr:hypothetical protein [Segetibacter sp.]
MRNRRLKTSCGRRARTFTRWLAKAQSSVVDPGRPVLLQGGSTLCLSHDPHPRDKRACLPKISSHHSIKKIYITLMINSKSCRGRARTSTRQLAIAQSSVVDPGRRVLLPNGSTLRLSCDPHPRDKRACLPKISSPHSVIKHLIAQY